MGKNNTKAGYSRRICILLILLVIVAWDGAKGDEANAPTISVYIRADYSRNSIGEDFDGNSVLVGGDVVVFIPDIEDAGSFGWFVGGSVEQDGFIVSLDLGYSEYERDSHWGIPPILFPSTQYRQYLIGLEVGKATRLFTPYFRLALHIQYLDVEEAFFDGEDLISVEYRGMGASYGLGLDFLPSSVISPYFRASWNLVRFSGVNEYLSDIPLEGTGWTVSAGIKVSIKVY